MRLCFICCEYPPGPHGGTGTFTQVIARALARRGHSVRVAGIYPSNYPAGDYEEDDRVRVWRLREPKFRGGWVEARYRLYRMIKSWIDAGEVELVDAPDHQGWFAGWPRLAAPLVQRSGGAYSYFAHEMGKPVSPVLFQLEKRSYHRADAWIAKSHYTGEVTARLFKLTNGPDAVLYNPVDAPRVSPPFQNRVENTVVYTGTLADKKGIIPLIDAWPSVRESSPRAHLHLFGKDGKAPNGGSMSSYLKERLAEALRPSVHFHGHVKRDMLLAVLKEASVAVFPSFSEGFAWSPLEAMAYGCPTIYTRLGSGPELIADGRDGLLIDPNRPVQIADAIVKVLEDATLAQKLGENGRRRVLQNFTLERLLPLNEDFYSELITSFQEKRRQRIKRLRKSAALRDSKFDPVKADGFSAQSATDHL